MKKEIAKKEYQHQIDADVRRDAAALIAEMQKQFPEKKLELSITNEFISYRKETNGTVYRTGAPYRGAGSRMNGSQILVYYEIPDSEDPRVKILEDYQRSRISASEYKNLMEAAESGL